MTELDRRQFLARTALGSAGVIAATGLGPLAAEAVAARGDVAPGERDPNFAEGKILSIDGGTLVVSSSDLLLQRIQVTSGTTFWKLHETTFDDVRVDDRLYARGVPTDDGTFLAERIWVNIVNLHVALVGIASDRLQLDHPGGRLVGHVVPDTVAAGLERCREEDATWWPVAMLPRPLLDQLNSFTSSATRPRRS